MMGPKGTVGLAVRIDETELVSGLVSSASVVLL